MSHTRNSAIRLADWREREVRRQGTCCCGLHRPRRHDVSDPPARRTLSSTPRAMGSIRKFWRLSQADRALLVQAAVWLGATRVALWVLPFRLVRRLLAQTARPSAARRGPRPSRHRLVWAVSLGRRVVPSSTCLVQALAAAALFIQHGHPADVRIGVMKDEAGGLIGHAWVESDGHVVVGDSSDLSRYAPLPPFPSAPDLTTHGTAS